jgi:RNAse (barnase) inhibitor barstar
MKQELLAEKKLLEDVFLKSKNRDGGTSESGVFKDVSTDLLNTHRINLSYRTLLAYYKSLVSEEIEYRPIKKSSLDAMSLYLEFKDYNEYKEQNGFYREQSANNDISVKIGNGIDAIADTVNSIIIKITHAPTFKFSEIINKNNAMGAGFFGLFLAAGSVAHFNGYFQKKDHMYWNGEEYRLTVAADLNPKHDVIPLDTVRLKYFRKITRPDTLDIDNGMDNVWYSKYQNKVEFFTMDGVNPDNQKELKPVSERIILKYASEK